jgi:nucleoside-diphosphate-sugar epimerase
MYGNYYFQRYGLPFVKARFQNVYGPREILGAGRWRGTPHTVWRNVISTFIWKSIQGEALPLDNGGNATRDFIFVEDMAEGLVACAIKGKPGEAYNLASGVETTIADLANTINQLTGNPTAVDLKPARDWDRSGKRFGSTEKSRNQLQFEASVPIQEGLRSTVEWTLANQDNIKRIKSNHDLLMKQQAR